MELKRLANLARLHHLNGNTDPLDHEETVRFLVEIEGLNEEQARKLVVHWEFDGALERDSRRGDLLYIAPVAHRRMIEESVTPSVSYDRLRELHFRLRLQRVS